MISIRRFALLFVVLSSAAVAQQEREPRGRRGAERGRPTAERREGLRELILRRFDRNRDGRLDPREKAALRSAIRGRVERRGDAREERRGGERRRPPEAGRRPGAGRGPAARGQEGRRPEIRKPEARGPKGRGPDARGPRAASRPGASTDPRGSERVDPRRPIGPPPFRRGPR